MRLFLLFLFLVPLLVLCYHHIHIVAPLARTHSLSSYTGYHTPIEDDENGSLINDPSEMPSEITGMANPKPSRGSLLVKFTLNSYYSPDDLIPNTPF